MFSQYDLQDHPNEPALVTEDGTDLVFLTLRARLMCRNLKLLGSVALFIVIVLNTCVHGEVEERLSRLYHRAFTGKCSKQKICLFIVSIGRSGSTALMDALNQFEKVFISGENINMMGHVWDLWTIVERFSSKEPVTAVENEFKYKLSVVSSKQKPAWYNNFDHRISDCLPSEIFKAIYGHGDFNDYIVGFKEIRFFDIQNLMKPRRGGGSHQFIFDKLNQSSYDDFSEYLDFHSLLCDSTKFLFNYRKQYNWTTGQGFYKGKHVVNTLKMRLQWLKQYQNSHRNDTMTVYYEDMFDKEVNGTLLEEIGKFIGKTLPPNATFARVPKT